MNNTLYLAREANAYVEAFPVGNGRLGAMMFGGAKRDRVVLNESTMWSGGPQDNDRKDAAEYLPEIRKLLFEGRNAQAQRLFESHFNCDGPGTGRAASAELPFGCYQTLGNLDLYYHQLSGGVARAGQSMSGGGQLENSSGYRRSLHLDEARSDMEYLLNGVRFYRECFAARSAECIVYRAWTDTAGGYLDLNVQLNRPERFVTRSEGADGLMMTGQLTGNDGLNGVRYACLVRAVVRGGSVSSADGILTIRRADEVLLYVAAATDMHTFGARCLSDPVAAVREDLDRAMATEYARLKETHIQAHRAYWERSDLSLGGGDWDKAPLDQLIRDFRENPDDATMAEIFFHYGRYLLICSARPDGMPPNLQGIWCDEIQTPWNGDWHLDAQQMNFWSAEVVGLPELHVPYLRLIQTLIPQGGVTAWDYYRAGGWVAHVVTNPWGYTAPGEDAYWGATTTGSAWLCQHLWDHYLFGRDEEYLRAFFPTLEGCAKFYLDFLVEDPNTGYMVTAPGISPENSFLTPEGEIVQLSVGPAYDMELIRYVFDACARACDILGGKDGFAKQLRETRARLAPCKIGEDGRLLEWIEPYPEAYPHHRHVSHLWGVYPGDEISPEDTPELAQAAAKTLKARGRSSAGWANTWRMGMYARLGMGREAYEMLAFQIRNNCFPNLFGRTYHAPETLENPPVPEDGKFDYPFQIDCSLAIPGCMAELLLQSQRFEEKDGQFVRKITFLPALPDCWAAGAAKGLRARDGFEIALEWKDGQVTTARIRATLDRAAQLTINGETFRHDFKAGETYTWTKD